MEMETIESKGLATAALLVFLMATTSQWVFGFYAADYYDSSATPKNLRGSHKGFSKVDIKCDQARLETHTKK